jgi:hypothetical protein
MNTRNFARGKILFMIKFILLSLIFILFALLFILLYNMQRLNIHSNMKFEKQEFRSN